MRIEDQVCSLEYAKKLKELGLKQESYFKWEDRECGYTELYHSKPTSISHKYFSAYSVAELGEMLPHLLNISMEGISDYYQDLKLTIEKCTDYAYEIRYEANYYTIWDCRFVGATLADCMGECLDCKDTGLLEVESVTISRPKYDRKNGLQHEIQGHGDWHKTQCHCVGED